MKYIINTLFCAFFLSSNLQGQTFGVIGDYGFSGIAEQEVADLVKSWEPDFIITLGDNNYENGDSATIDSNIGQYFHEFIYPYQGIYGPGDTINRFFPSLGNHDVRTNNGQAYLNYFTLPGNERYYDFIWGDVHFFSLNSNDSEPDGNLPGSVQAQWLQRALTASTSCWKVVYLHTSPYSSGEKYGSSSSLQWPYIEWGATIVLSGHSHVYERLLVNEMPYITNGLGGRSINVFGDPVLGSIIRYNEDYGAMLVEANTDSMTFKFINRKDSLIDHYAIADPVSISEQTNSMRLQNDPNPFESTTVISFILPYDGYVRLKIYNQYGGEISTLVAQYFLKGEHRVQWKPENLPSGVYFYCLFVDDILEVRKAILITSRPSVD